MTRLGPIFKSERSTQNGVRYKKKPVFMWLLADTFCSYRIAMHLHMGPFEDTIIMKETCFFFFWGGVLLPAVIFKPWMVGFEARMLPLCYFVPHPLRGSTF